MSQTASIQKKPMQKQSKSNKLSTQKSPNSVLKNESNIDISSKKQTKMITEIIDAINETEIPIELFKKDQFISNEKRTEYLDKLFKHIQDDSICKKIENSMYNFANNYVKSKNVNKKLAFSVYIDNFNELLANIDSDSELNNTYLLENIINSNIDPETVPYMEPHEIHPVEWKPILDKKKYIEHKSKNLATTNMFTCSKCKAKRHTINMMQTRSADEPMTIFVTCVDCGFTFKM